MEKDKQSTLDDCSLKRMDYKAIKEICKECDLYETDELNDVLYLQMKGFSNIDGLSSFCNLKCLFLNNNCIKKIENLEDLPNLKTLYLQNNDISCIENICCKKLLILNLSYNKIKKIENLKHLKFLQSLNISNNLIENTKDILEVCELENLSHFDISSNKLTLMKNEIDDGLLNTLLYKQDKQINEKDNEKTTDNRISENKNTEGETIEQTKEPYNENLKLLELKNVLKSKLESKSESVSMSVSEKEKEKDESVEYMDSLFFNKEGEEFSDFLNRFEKLKFEIRKNRNKVKNKLKYYEKLDNMNNLTKEYFYNFCELIIILKSIRKLKTLIIKNNPFTKQIRYIAKYIIANVPQLSFLDDKKVKTKDVLICQVFLRHGADKEKELIALLEKRKMEKYKNLTEKFHVFLMNKENGLSKKPPQ